MNKKEHIERHKALHKSLDELATDFAHHTLKFLSQATIMDLLKWSNTQTTNPTDKGKG